MSNEDPARSEPFMALDARADKSTVERKLLDTAPDAVVVVDTSGRIVYANQRTEQLFGYVGQELIGQGVEMLMPGQYRASHVDHRERYVAAPRIRPMGSGLALYGCRKGGAHFPIEISLSPVQTTEGLLTSASIRDVTVRIESEQRVRRIQEHLLSAVESIQGAFAIFDTDDHLVLCNSHCRLILGAVFGGELVGRSLEALLDENLKAGTFDLGPRSAAELRERYLAYHRTPAGALDLRTKDGRSLRVIERRTAEGGTVMTIWDVTDEVEHEEELRRARAVAEAASSAKSEFLSSMSHELRTPLNAILGFAQLLQRDRKAPLSERHQERIEQVVKGGEHLLRLIDEILDLSRIEAGRISLSLEPVRVAEVMADVRGTLAPMAARAEMSLIVAPISQDLPLVLADRTRFQQVLMNYASNSIKYGRKGGTVTFRACARGDRVRVSVEDDGIGIPLDKQDKIFHPFHRAGQETGTIEGTGIGLAISKHLAELMDGSIGFQSVPGKGSTFWMELPVLSETIDATAARPAPVSKDSSPLASKEGPRFVVVYIEDNPSNIAFMQALIADFDRVELVTAPSAEIGVEMVRSRKPNAVIMDIHLPGMNGFEAAKLLREGPETRQIPVIALSAAASVGNSKQVSEAGFYRYLTKPVKVDELSQALEELFLLAR